MAGPIEQFEVKPIVPIDVAGIDVSFTNASLWMVLTTMLVSVIMIFGTQRRALVPNRLQAFCEILYDGVAGMVRDNVGDDGRKYFPFIFALFMFVLFGNLLGMIPYSYTFTSQLVVTFGFAFVIFLAVTVIGFVKNGAGYLNMFFPPGAPLWTGVILIPIEIISYLSRPISLSVRLFANMTVGHVLLKVIAGFVISLGVFGLVPLLALSALIALEFMIAVIQAYIFTILSCIYLSDALHPHH